MRYTFGHTDIAVERLRSIAEFFNPLADDFIRKNLNKSVVKAADLGCGPGYTTHMLANVTKASNITGFDISGYFIEKARLQYPELNFVKQDITQWNTNEKFDVLYCRFLLSHLNNIRQILRNWEEHLNPGGLIFIDELEDIYTQVQVFQKYLSMNLSLVRSQGAELYVGKILDEYIAGFRSILNQSSIIPVYNWQAAGWFYPNTTSIWNDEDIVRNTLSRQQRIKIAKDLLAIWYNKNTQSNITWKMKRIILTTKYTEK
jgi:2-polyprenyl-3-methyl-5-hydroxy-6-metoxy-1,4-benzoquinol methylase